MDYIRAYAALTDLVAAIDFKKAQELVPKCPGIYAILVQHLDALPKEIQQHQKNIAALENVLYIGVGKAKGGGLFQRLIKQDLLHKGHSTFFRSLGAVLGYTPPPGSLTGKKNQWNYKFSEEDKTEIVGWISKHLRINYVAGKKAVSWEKSLIKCLKPALNLQSNPKRCKFVKDKRRTCREIAVQKPDEHTQVLRLESRQDSGSR